MSILTTLLLTIPGIAQATEPPAPAKRLSLRAGLGTPLGLAGLEYEHSLTPVFSVAGGVGGNAEGLQFALTPRFWRSSDRLSLGLGAGLSVGGMQSFEEATSADPVERGTDLGLFGHAEILVRVRFSGFFVGVFAGYSRLLYELKKRQDVSWPVQKDIAFGGLELGVVF